MAEDEPIQSKLQRMWSNETESLEMEDTAIMDSWLNATEAPVEKASKSSKSGKSRPRTAAYVLFLSIHLFWF